MENIEQKTYQLYLDKNWDGLIKYGKMAIDQGHDYFYIQMRVGIAYYEKKNYCLAEGYFKKALKQNSDDELAKEYLYYCYFFTGRQEDARMLSQTFTKELAAKIGTDKQSPVEFILAEGGTKTSDSSSYYDKTKKTSSIYFDPATYLQVGLCHHVKNRASLFHAFTHFSQQSYLGSLKQTQYFIKSAIPFKKNWQVSPALHWIHTKFDTETLPLPNPLHPGPPPKTQTITTASNYFVGALSVQKIIKKFTLSLGTTVSNMSNNTQYIHSGFVSYSIFGNSKLVVGCSGYLHTINSYSTLNTSAAPFVYFQPINVLSIKVSYLSNAGNNIIEDNGYFVNNSPDLTRSRWSFTANCNINKHLSLYALYQLEYKQESVQLFNYRYNIIVAGIKIRP